jgi:hypothetical protein
MTGARLGLFSPDDIDTGIRSVGRTRLASPEPRSSALPTHGPPHA